MSSYTYFSSPGPAVPETKLTLSILSDSSSPSIRRIVQKLTEELAKVPWLLVSEVSPDQKVREVSPDQKVSEASPDILFLIGSPAYVHDALQVQVQTRVWVYLLQRYETLDPDHVATLNAKADRIFSPHREWRSLQRQQGITRPIDLLPVSTHSPAPIPTRQEGRAILHIPEEVILFLSLNRNVPHKRYDILIQAFVELIVKHPQKPLFLMCVCEKGCNKEFSDKDTSSEGLPLFDLFSQTLKQKGVAVADFSSRLMLSTRFTALPTAASVAPTGEPWVSASRSTWPTAFRRSSATWWPIEPSVRRPIPFSSIRSCAFGAART